MRIGDATGEIKWPRFTVDMNSGPTCGKVVCHTNSSSNPGKACENEQVGVQRVDSPLDQEFAHAKEPQGGVHHTSRWNKWVVSSAHH